jgi:hypothetical protein
MAGQAEGRDPAMANALESFLHGGAEQRHLPPVAHRAMLADCG